jgi:hypothetical protein
MYVSRRSAATLERGMRGQRREQRRRVPRGSRAAAREHRGGVKRERLLVLDLLESFVRERNAEVLLARRRDGGWTCRLRTGAVGAYSAAGGSAREALRGALAAAGVALPD